jgi:hypothetical protein
MEQTPEGEPGLGMIVDCNSCAMRDTDVCRECVVTFVLDRADEAVVFDAAEERAIRAMSKAGLLPLLRWEKRTG